MQSEEAFCQVPDVGLHETRGQYDGERRGGSTTQSVGSGKTRIQCTCIIRELSAKIS